MTSWRQEALEYLRQMEFDGVVFVPEPEDGVWRDEYSAQVEWEEQGLHFADVIVFWIPRDLDVLPGFTTNVEFGRWVDSHKVVLGHPTSAPKTRYLDEVYAKATQQPVHDSLTAVLDAAVDRLGEGARRTDGERHVPLHVWTSRFFQSWYENLQRVGNRLDEARLHWVFYLPKIQQVLAGVLWVKVWVESEGRHKQNEWIFGRTDINSIILFEPPPRAYKMETLLKTEIVLIREFRSPARTVDGFVHELPGGSSVKAGQDPREVAAQEVQEETGLALTADRFTSIDSRPAAATVSTHHIHLQSAALTKTEMEAARRAANERASFGNAQETERTTIEIVTITDLLQTRTVDWSTLGMVMKALYDSGAEHRPASSKS